jgi:hypothetical protein
MDVWIERALVHPFHRFFDDVCICFFTARFRVVLEKLKFQFRRSTS